MIPHPETAVKKVLILYAFNTTGHRAAACALEDAFSQCSKQCSVQSANILAMMGRRYEEWCFRFYKFAGYDFPWLWSILYNNRTAHALCACLMRVVVLFRLEIVRRLIESYRPDVIICTEALPVMIISALGRQGWWHGQLVAVLTDYAPNIYWISESVDWYVLGAAHTGKLLQETGVALERIKILGIPVHPAFSEGSANGGACTGNGAMVLILGGGRGWGRILEIIREADAVPFPFEMIVVCGNNLTLQQTLEKQRSSFGRRLTVLGRVTAQEMNQLLIRARVAVSKGGGLTIAECLAKGVPLVVVGCVTGQETLNALFLEQRGAAVLSTVQEIRRTLLRLLVDDRAALESLATNALNLGRPTAAVDIVRFVETLVPDQPQPGATDFTGAGVQRQDRQRHQCGLGESRRSLWSRWPAELHFPAGTVTDHEVIP